jgi:hypothetical protein
LLPPGFLFDASLVAVDPNTRFPLERKRTVRTPPIMSAAKGQHRILDKIATGRLIRRTAPGLGITLTPEIEAAYPFDDSAVYSCMLQDWGPPPDANWKR